MQQIRNILHEIDETIPRGTPLSTRTRLFFLPLDLYLGVLIAYFLLRAVTGWVLWPVELISDFLIFLLVPAFAFAVLMLVLQRWRRAASAVFLSIMWLLLFGGMVLRQSESQIVSDSNDIQFTVMTYNIGYGLAEPDNLVEALRNSGVDVIGLQEVSPEQGNAIRDELYDMYPYQEIYLEDQSGLGVLSRFPIVSSEYVPPVNQHIPSYARTSISISDTKLDVFVFRVHPPRIGKHIRQNPRTGTNRLHYGYLTWQGADTISEVAREYGPAIMLVDMNATDQGSQHKRVRQNGFSDAFQLAGQGFGLTFPNRDDGWRDISDIPFARIDYIFVTEDIVTLDAWLGPDAGSDHLPVVAQLGLTESE